MKTAHSVMVMFCDGCDAAHLVLYDEEDRPFAQAVIDDDIVTSLMLALRTGEPSRWNERQ